MWMRPEVQLPSPPIGYVGVELGRAEICVSEHLLHGAEIRAALEQVGRERVPQEVRVHAFGLEAGCLGEPSQDQEGACPCQPAALRVEEELGAVAPVEIRAPAREVPP
jgi:hypothetical protein